MSRGINPLSERDLDTLDDLEHASDYALKHGHREGFVRVMDCGGTNGSHHGGTLRKLFDREVCERKSYGHLRKTHLYRINTKGRAILIAWRNGKRAIPQK